MRRIAVVIRWWSLELSANVANGKVSGLIELSAWFEDAFTALIETKNTDGLFHLKTGFHHERTDVFVRNGMRTYVVTVPDSIPDAQDTSIHIVGDVVGYNVCEICEISLILDASFP